jgi:hypothetical protein
MFIELFFHIVNCLSIHDDITDVLNCGEAQVETANQHGVFVYVTFYVNIVGDSNVGFGCTFASYQTLERF